MLVNHLAKRHPDIRPEDVPELNLPILRTQKDYYCQYCDKVRQPKMNTTMRFKALSLFLMQMRIGFEKKKNKLPFMNKKI